MREVKFKKWIPIEYFKDEGFPYKQRVKGTGMSEDDFKSKGLFHKWGNNCEEYENGVGNYTIALVELEDGTIQEVLPINLKFVN